MPLNVSTTIRVQGSLSKPAATPAEQAATYPVEISKTFPLADGVSANQADRMYSKTLTIAPSATQTLDLAGVLTDVFGAALTFAKIKKILAFPSVANANNLNIVRPATNGVPILLAASDGVAVPPGGFWAWGAPGAGIAITPGTGDLLDFVNAAGGTSITVDVHIFGTSA